MPASARVGYSISHTGRALPLVLWKPTATNYRRMREVRPVIRAHNGFPGLTTSLTGLIGWTGSAWNLMGAGASRAAEAGGALPTDPATNTPAVRRANGTMREMGRLDFMVVPFGGGGNVSG